MNRHQISHKQLQLPGATPVKRRRAIIVLQVVVEQVLVDGHKVQQPDQLIVYSAGGSDATNGYDESDGGKKGKHKRELVASTAMEYHNVNIYIYMFGQVVNCVLVKQINYSILLYLL